MDIVKWQKEERTFRKAGRSKDMLRGLSWQIVGESTGVSGVQGTSLTMEDFRNAVQGEQGERCVSDVCLPGFDLGKLKIARKHGQTGFFFVANMSESGPSVSRKVTLAARARNQSPVFFQLAFNVQVDKYTKGNDMDWDSLTYLQAYHLYKDHLSAIWSRVAHSDAQGRDALLRYSNLHDALTDDPLLAITTLWEVFPTLQAVTWDLPIDGVPRVRGMAIRSADFLEKATVLAPWLGHIPGEWRLCDQAGISEWPA